MQGSIIFKNMPKSMKKIFEEKKKTLVTVDKKFDDMLLKVEDHIKNNPISEFFNTKSMSLPHSNTKFEVYFRPRVEYNNSINHLYDVRLKGLYELYGTDRSNNDNVWTGEYKQAYQTWKDFIKNDFKDPSNKLVMDFFHTMGAVPIQKGFIYKDMPSDYQVKQDYNYWRRQWFIHGCLHFDKPIDYFWYMLYLFHWISSYGINLYTKYWNQKESEERRGSYHEVITCNVQFSRKKFVKKWRSKSIY